MKWIKITERVPKNNQEVLCFTKAKEIALGTFEIGFPEDTIYIHGHGMEYTSFITHWTDIKKPNEKQ